MILRRFILVILCVISISPIFILAGGAWWLIDKAESAYHQQTTQVIHNPKH